MKNIHIYSIGLLCPVFLFTGCNPQLQETDSANIKSISFDVEKFHSMENFSYHIKSIEITELETYEDYIFGQVDKVIATKDYYYVLDTRTNKTITAFTANGKFKFQINSIGNGPSKYKILKDMDVDEDSNSLVVLASNKVIIFDALTGAFQKQVRISGTLAFSCAYKGGDYVYLGTRSGNGGYGMCVLNLRTSQIDFKYIDIPRGLSKSVIRKFMKHKDQISFKSPIENMVYQIGQFDKIFPTYKIDYLDEQGKEIKDQGSIESMPIKYSEIFETGEFININHLMGDHSLYVFYGKKSGESKVFKRERLQNRRISIPDLENITLMRLVTPFFQGSSEDYFIKHISGAAINAWLTGIKKREKYLESSKFSSIYQRLFEIDSYSNGVILKLKLKEFSEAEEKQDFDITFTS